MLQEGLTKDLAVLGILLTRLVGIEVYERGKKQDLRYAWVNFARAFGFFGFFAAAVGTIRRGFLICIDTLLSVSMSVSIVFPHTPP